VLFKLPKHRRYEYQYRYHDPEKDEARKREKFIRAESRRIIKGSQDSALEMHQQRRDYHRSASLRTFVILLILIALVFGVFMLG
jgi:hypothetical protein